MVERRVSKFLRSLFARAAPHYQRLGRDESETLVSLGHQLASDSPPGSPQNPTGSAGGAQVHSGPSMEEADGGVPAPQREPIVQMSSEARLRSALGPRMAPQNT